MNYDVEGSELKQLAARSSRRRGEFIAKVLRTDELLKRELDESQWSKVRKMLVQGYDQTARSARNP